MAAGCYICQASATVEFVLQWNLCGECKTKTLTWLMQQRENHLRRAAEQILLLTAEPQILTYDVLFVNPSETRDPSPVPFVILNP